jgi:hypothetical protein
MPRKKSFVSPSRGVETHIWKNSPLKIISNVPGSLDKKGKESAILHGVFHLFSLTNPAQAKFYENERRLTSVYSWTVSWSDVIIKLKYYSP